jgi:hypothetical protein
MANLFNDAFSKVVKENTAGVSGKAFLGLGIADIATSNNKLKATLGLIRDILLQNQLMQVAFIAGYRAMNKGVQSLLHDTGSLDAMLRKLANIRGLEKSLAPFVGGINAAKSRVAELVVLAAQSKGNFRFEEFGAAAQSLTVFTRGAYSSAEAINVVADAAAATNNSLTGTAGAVGDFYSALRSGQGIDAATESMRQMGLITQQDADYFDKLSASGADAARIATEMQMALARHKGGQEKAGKSNSPEDVNAAREKAVQGAKEAFAAPFTERDITNTRNFTDALQAATPAIAAVSNTLATITGSFVNFGSWLTKTAAESPLLTGALTILAQVLGIAGTVAAALSGVALVAWLGGITSATFAYTSAAAAGSAATHLLEVAMFAFGISAETAGMGLGVLTVAIRALAAAGVLAEIATGIGILIAVAGALVAAFSMAKGAINDLLNAMGIYVGEARKTAKAIREMESAFKDSNKAIKDQIAAVTDLASRHAALQSALAGVKAASEKLENIQKEGKQKGESQGKYEARVNEAKKELTAAQATLGGISQGDLKGLGTPAKQQQAEAEADARQRVIDESFQARMEMAGSPEEKIGIRGQQIDYIGYKEDTARKENAADVGVEADKEKAHGRVVDIQGEMAAADARQKEADKEVKAAEKFHPWSSTASQNERLRKAKENQQAAKAASKSLRGQFNEASAAELAVGTQSQYAGSAQSAEAHAQQIREYLMSQRTGLPKEEQQYHATMAGGMKGTEEQAEALEQYARQQRAIQKGLPEYAAQKQSLQATQTQAQREADLAQKRVGAEREIAELKSRGFERAQDETSIRLKLLDKEKAAALARGDLVGVFRISGEQSATVFAGQEAARSEAFEREDLDREHQIKQAEVKSDTKSVVRLGDLSDFSQSYQQLVGQGFKPEEAKKRAMQEADDNIDKSAAEMAAHPVVDSMQRIAGGGGAASNPLLTAAQRHAALQENANKLLQQIAEAVKSNGPDTPADTSVYFSV